MDPPTDLIEHLAAGHFKPTDTGDDVENRPRVPV